MIAAIIIAGGKARRFNGADKAMIPLSGKPLLEHILDRISSQVDRIAINRSAALEGYDLEYVADLDDEQCGPIGGLEAAIKWASELEPAPDYLLSVPVDTPHLPLDLVDKLLPAAEKNGAAIAATSSGLQPTISLHRLGHISQSQIQSFKHKAFRKFWAHIGAAKIIFDTESDFANINCAEDIERYENNRS